MHMYNTTIMTIIMITTRVRKTYCDDYYSDNYDNNKNDDNDDNYYDIAHV